MKKKLSFLMLFILIFNIFINGFMMNASYAATIDPMINNITIREIVEVVGGQKTTSYQVIFNGLALTQNDTIVVMVHDGLEFDIKHAISPQELTYVNSSRLDYTPEGTGLSIKGMFGITENDEEVYFGIVRNNFLYSPSISKIFKLPVKDFNLMKIDEINNGTPAAWPVTVIKGTDALAIKGVDFTNEYTFGITTGNTVNSSVGYTVVDSNNITVDTSTISAMNNQNLVFELKKYENVNIAYIVKNAVNIANPLNLQGVEITPMQGTQGTILRIKAGNPTPLLDPGTKIYIDGVEAKRNIGPFSDGTFTYTENGVPKQGLEVIVPKLATTGQKQITIVNYFGDIYNHGPKFTYTGALSSVLEIMDVSPTKGFTNIENDINMLRIRNLVALNNIQNIDKIGMIIEEGNASNIKYFEDVDPKSKYVLYKLANGKYVERKITVNVALKAEITSLPVAPASIDADGSSVISIKTDKVSQAGSYVITTRTETVYYEVDVADKITEIDFIVEEAPYTTQSKLYYEFQPDTTTPVITKITPNKGPYDEIITATIEGQQFRVEGSAQNRYYPRVIIGTDAIVVSEKYKVITINSLGNVEAYYSSKADGSVNEGAINIPGLKFEVLTADDVVVDGQAIKSGAKIKFTIPAGSPIYTGYADVTVFNPNPLGGLGGRDTKENFFQYVNPPSGALLPIIDEVTPNKVAVGKEEQVVIKGRNFQPGAIVTVDGEQVTNPVIDVVKGTITFKAPKGRVGVTTVQVINPDGGFASAPFEYIQTFSQPTITRIIPNVGGKGALVIIKGTGFYPANEQGENDQIKIGTRVYIDGKDVNDEFFYIEDPLDPLETILDLRDFVNIYDGDTLIPGADGQPIKTYSSNIAVVDNETIYMLVPDPDELGFFKNEFLDVKVVNPDLGSHTLSKGFKFIDVATKPSITSITPNLGDYRGGNIAEIQGDFLLEGVKVYFGTQEAQVYRRSNNARTIWVYVPAYGDVLENTNSAMVPVTVLNANGGSHTKYDGYTYVNPGYDVRITKLTPNVGNTSGGDRILISGDGFRAHNYGSTDPAHPQQLPAVYFGGIRVPEDKVTFVIPPKGTYNAIETSDMIIVEYTPPNPAGRVDVTVINYDGAIATMKSAFEYRSKQPAITNVLPKQGTMYGGSEITITGKDFVENGLHVVFGDEVAAQDILSGQAEVRIGDVIVRYNAYAPDNISLYYKDVEPGKELNVYKDGTPTNTFSIIEEEEFIIVRINWSGLPPAQADQNTIHMADENIKIEIKDSNLVLTRRLGVIKRLEGENKIVLLTPPSSEVGKKTLTVYNYDGKNAKSDFTYTNPFRAPVITNITPVSDMTVTEINGVPYTGTNPIKVATASPVGGSPLIITGENFRAGVKVFIDGKEATIKNKSPNDDELIITVPAADTAVVGQFLRILVLNEDGGSAYGDQVIPNPFYFRYITEGSSPTITSVTPALGPVSGGTKVTIKGTGFKDRDSFNNPKIVQVLIGGIPVPQANVTYIDPQTLEVIMPEGRIGKQTIEVINYDYGRAIGTDIFTYISQPEILTVNPGKLFTNDTQTEVIVSGRQFLTGAKLIIGGVMMLEKDVQPGQTITARGIRGVDSNGNNREMVVVGGIEAASVVVENENTLKVTFNEALDLENSHMIVVNTDGGLSSEYKSFEYQIPVPSKPLVLEAIPGAEASVLLVWSDSHPEVLNRADRYEIYGKLSSEREYVFLGDTRDTDFLVKGLQQNQNYSFMVRAMNRYGSALEFAEATVRTFNEREDQQLREKLEAIEKEQQKFRKEGKEEISGATVIRTIGTEEIPAGTTPYVIDFSLSKYSKQNKFVVAIPLSVVQSLNRSITITDGTLSFTLLPKDLFTREVSQVNVKDLNDTHVRVSVERLAGQKAEAVITAIGRTQRRASEVYEIDFQLQVSNTITAIAGMLRNGTMSIKFEEVAYPTADKNKLFLGQYNASAHSFTKLGSSNTGSTKNKGRYMLLSDR